jgi:hypothetical protein
MPFWVYGCDSETGEPTRPIFSDAANEDDACAEAIAQGMVVELVTRHVERPADEISNMDTLSKFKSEILDRREWFETLHSSTFQFADREIAAILAGFGDVHGSWIKVQNNAMLSEVPLENIVEMLGLVEDLSVKIPLVCKNASRFDNEFAVISELFECGENVIENTPS